MFGNIHFENCDSSIASPIGFFSCFIKAGAIKKCKNNFFDNAISVITPHEYSHYNKITIVQSLSLPVTIDKKKATIVVEYQEEIEYDEYLGPKYEWKSNVYEFDKLLKELLNSQVQESISLFKSKLETLNRKRKREIIGDSIKKILDVIDIIEIDKDFKKYRRTSIQACYALIQFLFKDYEDFCPAQNTDKRIGEILLASENTKYLFVSQKINVSILPYLVQHSKLKLGVTIDKKDNKLTLEEAWTYFLEGDFEKITSRISFPANLEFSSFLLTEIVSVLSYNLAKLERMRIFFFDRGKMDLKLVYKNRSIFIKKHPDEVYKIRVLISRHKC
jgi:hypothetical protein